MHQRLPCSVDLFVPDQPNLQDLDRGEGNFTSRGAFLRKATAVLALHFYWVWFQPSVSQAVDFCERV